MRTFRVEVTVRITGFFFLHALNWMMRYILLSFTPRQCSPFYRNSWAAPDCHRLSQFKGCNFGRSNKQRDALNTTDLFQQQFSGSRTALKRASFGRSLCLSLQTESLLHCSSVYPSSCEARAKNETACKAFIEEAHSSQKSRQFCLTPRSLKGKWPLN